MVTVLTPSPRAARRAGARVRARRRPRSSKAICAITTPSRRSSRGQDVVFNLPASPAPSAAWRIRGRPRRELPRQPRAARSASRAQSGREAGVRRLAACSTASRRGCRWLKSDLADPLCVHAVHKLTVGAIPAAVSAPVRPAICRCPGDQSVRPGPAGGRTAYGIVNRMIHLALADEPLPIYGDGAQQRDYIHVDDVVDALMHPGRNRRERRRRLQRRQRRRHPHDRHGASSSSSSPAADAIELVRVAGAGRADRDRRLRRRHVADSRASSAGRRRCRCATVWSGRSRTTARASSRDAWSGSASSISRTRSWSAAPRRWCSTSCAICRRGSSRWCAASTQPGPIGEEIRQHRHAVHRARPDPGVAAAVRRARHRADLLRETQPHIVHTFLLTASLYGRLAAILARVPIVIGTEVNIYEHKRPAHAIGERLLMRGTDRVVVSAESVRDFYIRQVHARPDEGRRDLQRGGLVAQLDATMTRDEMRASRSACRPTRRSRASSPG